LFTSNVPWSCVLRIWDLFILEGFPVIYATSMALFKIIQEKLLETTEFERIYNLINCNNIEIHHQVFSLHILYFLPKVKEKLPKVEQLWLSQQQQSKTQENEKSNN